MIMSRGYYGSLGIIALLLQSTSVGAFIAAAPGARAASCCVVQQGAGEFGRFGAHVGCRTRTIVTAAAAVSTAGAAEGVYDAVMPFLKEHIQPSDQLLIFGAGNDLPLRLSEDGYGTRDRRSFIIVIDSDEAAIEKAKALGATMEKCSVNMADGRLRFEHRPDMAAITDLEQSSVDAVLDNFCLDSVTAAADHEAAGRCIDAAHTAVRLGNPMISLSARTVRDFTVPFDSRFGWVQELDGDPGAVSMWHRGRINVADEKNSLAAMGIYFYVYTNTDNC